LRLRVLHRYPFLLLALVAVLLYVDLLKAAVVAENSVI
jgi:hypothetical protein